ncbi:MAG: transcription elongation factor GreB [Bacteriovoracia bacterium]
MSKAFTKESDGGLDDDGDTGEPKDDLPAGAKNYITPAGAARLREELKQLMNVERPKVVTTVSWAASNGDRSENGDYIYGKRRLREIDRRIRFLSKRLEIAEIIDPLTQAKDRVLFGATVTVEHESGEKRKYRIVGMDETDAAKRYISWTSPIGRALLQAKKGDTIQVRTPKGEEELEVLLIQYQTE